ncbi:AraC family transcriptional regulator [Cellulosilyticum sp. I15G10I2]|uniref:AraC family transcriptional regulator n=1 Tax=Cellulosilyticum sp. I15G10I2 TaxID=1892843 RepID=UPI00085BC92E|nr:helix-turn-helix domain-containing protein [Cellulosilyticum sp. I15G10I2]
MSDKLLFKQDGFKNEQYIIIPTESFAQHAEHPLIRGLFLTDVGYFPNAAYHYKERKEGTGENILIYCTEGKGVIEVKDKRYAIGMNEVFCIPSHSQHKYYASQEDPWSILWVHFKGENTNFFPIQEMQVIKMNSSHANNRMMFLFDLLFRVLERNYTLGNFIYLSQVLSLMLSEIYYREKVSETGKQNKYLTTVIRYMYNNVHQNISLDMIAEQLDLSKSYLNAIFKKYTQKSPIDFFISLKMQEACKLLKLKDMHVYEVSRQLGYEDQYYFSRIFKKVIGVSPKEYKQGEHINYKG